MVTGPSDMGGPRRKLRVDVMAAQQETARGFLAELRTSMRQRNVYRGHVISLVQEMMGFQVRFHQLPKIERSQIILPDGVLERVERHTIGFARHSAQLLAGGWHLKRGLLLHGPPGTGKTLTAMYLAGRCGTEPSCCSPAAA